MQPLEDSLVPPTGRQHTIWSLGCCYRNSCLSPEQTSLLPLWLCLSLPFPLCIRARHNCCCCSPLTGHSPSSVYKRVRIFLKEMATGVSCTLCLLLVTDLLSSCPISVTTLLQLLSMKLSFFQSIWRLSSSSSNSLTWSARGCTWAHFPQIYV